MPKNRDQLEHLREMASLMRRLSGDHTAADNPLIAAKLAEVAVELETRAMVLERIPLR
jgi:alkylation response protein AidB-like acyl-CoA dehydrogenase